MNRKKLQICIVNPFQHGGGAEYQVGCLTDVLAQTGECDIYYLARHTDARLEARQYHVVQIGQSERVPRFGYLMDAVPLYRALSRLRPDVVYQRVAGGYTGVCAYYARRNGIRMVWHVAHDSDVCPDSRFYGRNPIRRYLEKASVEYGVRHASYIVTQTEHQAHLLAKYYGRKADAVIRNFHPAPAESIIKNGPPLILWVANLKPWKRPDAFVQIAKQLIDLKDARFVMVGAPPTGSGDREWRAKLMESIQECPNLEYCGQLTHTDVNRLLACAHVFVNTSVQEGFPNTFIQAWLREVPVVSLGVNPDHVLESEQVGICVENIEQMAHAVRSLVNDRELCAQYAARAKRHALRHHSMRNASELANLIMDGRVKISHCPIKGRSPLSGSLGKD